MCGKNRDFGIKISMKFTNFQCHNNKIIQLSTTPQKASTASTGRPLWALALDTLETNAIGCISSYRPASADLWCKQKRNRKRYVALCMVQNLSVFTVSKLTASDNLEEKLGLRGKFGCTEMGTDLGFEKKIFKLQITC